MATEQALKCISIPASGDLSASQYRFVLTNSSGQIAAVAAAGGNADGVLQDKPDAAGRPGCVAINGVTLVEASAAIAAGANVSASANGRAVTSTTAYAVLGRALEAATAAGQLIPVLLFQSVEPA